MKRKNRFDSFEEAVERGPYDEMPMLELGFDPQLHLSRNDVGQPFFLICEKDTVLAQLSGSARLEFARGSVNYFDMVIGDFAYIPAGVPHRIIPAQESVHLRYKAADPGLEAVAWYSERAHAETARVTWDCAVELPQDAYQRACEAFNADEQMRTCPVTGDVLPQVDLSPFRWQEVAEEIRAAEEAEKARAVRKHGESVLRQKSGSAEIAPPDDRKSPLKTNVYDFGRSVTAALAPIFPYLGPGCIVPCVALNDAGAAGDFGYFIHTNTVHEVNLSFGTRGGMRTAGGVSVGPFTHPVGAKRGQSFPPDFMNLAVITQRQDDSGDQSEALVFVCDECSEELYRRDYDAHSYPDAFASEDDPGLMGMPTIAQSAFAATEFNTDESLRTCKACGHVSEPFPIDAWGWGPYRRRTNLVLEARELMRDAAGKITTTEDRT